MAVIVLSLTSNGTLNVVGFIFVLFVFCNNDGAPGAWPNLLGPLLIKSTAWAMEGF